MLQWGCDERAADFFDVRGDIEALFTPLRPRFVAAPHPALHPGRSARVEVDEGAIGWVGELHPRWVQRYELPQAPVLFELELAELLRRPVPSPRAIPRHPSVVRDLALVVGEAVTHDAVVAALSDDSQGLVRSVRLFDLYKPKAATASLGARERSLAVRLELRDDEGTLTDGRIDDAMSAALQRAQQRIGARLRT
jgi:phenylalanyl-tRNA synthetase beta chain